MRARKSMPAALLSCDLRDQARGAAPLRWVDSLTNPSLSRSTAAPRCRRLPFLCLSVSGRNLRLRRSGSRRTLSGQTDSGGCHDSSLPSAAAKRGNGKIGTLSRDVTHMKRTRRCTVKLSIGDVHLCAEEPVVLQSMTNTDTADVEATA